MKKILATSLIFLMITLYAPLVFAESVELDGFSLAFPDNFIAELKEAEPEISTDYFSATESYYAESVYELFTINIGENEALDTLFSDDFGFAHRADLDLSLLTESQLNAEADKLAAFIDDTFPVYMNYLSPKSIEVDERLGLMVTGYYTDYENGLTGQMRVYEFYFMGETILFYYDTQIEGTYFNEAVFELPDAIVATVDFENNPVAAPLNSERFSNAIDMAVPVIIVLILALFIGALFGLIGRKAKEVKQKHEVVPEFSPIAETADAYIDAAATAPAAQQSNDITPEFTPIAETTDAYLDEASKAKPKKKPAKAVDEPTPSEMIEQSADETEEAVDWHAMVSQIKQETLSAPSDSTNDKPNAKTDNTDETTENAEHITGNIEESFKEIGHLAQMIKDKLHIGKHSDEPEQTEKEAPEPEQKPDISYEEYLNNFLPKKKTRKVKDRPVITEETPDMPKPEAEPEIKPEEKTLPTAENESTPSSKKTGFVSKILGNIIKKIETSEDEDDVPEFESRVEMHIKEKTEKNPVEKLMPGLFDDEPEPEPVEILLDENIDIRAEQEKDSEKEAGSQEQNEKAGSKLKKLFRKKKTEDDV